METAKELDPTEKLYQSAYKHRSGQNLAPVVSFVALSRASMCAVYNRSFPLRKRTLPLRFQNTTQWWYELYESPP